MPTVVAGLGVSERRLSLFPHDVSQPAAARITKLNKEMCPGNPFILG